MTLDSVGLEAAAKALGEFYGGRMAEDAHGAEAAVRAYLAAVVPVTPTTENPYPTEPVGSTAAHKHGAWAACAAAGRAAATSDGWTPTSDAPDAPGWECELCGGKLDGPGEKCGSAQHGPAGSVVYGRAVPAGSLDVGDEPDERFAPPGDADRVMHGLVPPSVDLRDEDAIRRDERERLSARVDERPELMVHAEVRSTDAIRTFYEVPDTLSKLLWRDRSGTFCQALGDLVAARFVAGEAVSVAAVHHVEKMRELRAERDAALAAGQNMANALERNCPCYCDHPLRADLPPCSRCSSLAAWRSVSGSERTDDDRND